jgi:hypothetical protein|tara:strand:- start:720 stop:941 length:222 start_codon:yes stop_codon:yes gene_type:complete
LSGISILLHFVIGFTIFSYGSGKMDSKLVFGLAIIAVIGLYIAGPHPFLFGMILATGWCLLNMGVERIFPILD